MRILLRTLAVLALAANLNVALAQSAPVDDETIFVEVDAALRHQRSLRGTAIHVRAQEGTVTLSGSARTTEEIALAGSLASRVRGVSTVNNEIRVSNRRSRAAT
jgi:hyperosmotically inducible protein